MSIKKEEEVLKSTSIETCRAPCGMTSSEVFAAAVVAQVVKFATKTNQYKWWWKLNLNKKKIYIAC